MDITAKKRHIVLIALGIIFCFFIFAAAQALAVSPPEDVDYGLSADEQQGGGGAWQGKSSESLMVTISRTGQTSIFHHPTALAFLLTLHTIAYPGLQAILDLAGPIPMNAPSIPPLRLKVRLM
ncbi:MAG: hypothetical protein JRF53_16690 [Deltaproteobacteria bacterium]|nr:hypothetical protein [Deltaproteobacteria bacterium]